MDKKETTQFDPNSNQYPPDDLCLKCGLCCKIVALTLSTKELVKMATENDSFAKSFLELYNPYPTSHTAKSINNDFYKTIKKTFYQNYKSEHIHFYYCKYLSNNNKCTIYEKRKESCRKFPENAWVVTPKNCGYKGWQFEYREEKKKQVRQMKEILEELKYFDDEQIVTSDGQKAKDLTTKILKKIEPLKRFGADEW